MARAEPSDFARPRLAEGRGRRGTGGEESSPEEEEEREGALGMELESESEAALGVVGRRRVEGPMCVEETSLGLGAGRGGGPRSLSEPRSSVVELMRGRRGVGAMSVADEAMTSIELGCVGGGRVDLLLVSLEVVRFGGGGREVLVLGGPCDDR